LISQLWNYNVLNLTAAALRATCALAVFAWICDPQAANSLVIAQDSPVASLKTKAEATDFAETSSHSDVEAFCDQLAKLSPRVRRTDFGLSHGGKKLPLLIIADPPIETPAEAAESGKLVVLVWANIHAGEVDGKEAVLMISREIATAKESPLLKDLVLLIAPNLNADGNDKWGAVRRSQQGPDKIGTRENAQGFDLNRDFVKLESPEIRALVRLMNQWDPAISVDCHTTNGSYHRMIITYEGGRCPAGDLAVVDYTRDQMLPAITEKMKTAHGYESFFYGNFTRDRRGWDTVPPTPRYSTHLIGMRNRIGILSESYSHASFKDRVLGSKAFVESIFIQAAEKKVEIAKLLKEADDRTLGMGKKPGDAPPLALDFKDAVLGGKRIIPGYIEEQRNGRSVPTEKPWEYEVEYLGATEVTNSTPRAFAYVFPDDYAEAAMTLQRHGIVVEELREDIDFEVEVQKVTKVTKGQRFQGHESPTLVTESRKETARLAAGSYLVKTGQKLGSLASFLLEAESNDGLATWNYFDAGIADGKDFPVMRILAPAELLTTQAKPLPESMRSNLAVTADSAAVFAGAAISIRGWHEDGQHYFQAKNGVTHKVHAHTGASSPYTELDKLDRSRGGRGGRPGGRPGAGSQINSQRTGAVYITQKDLVFVDKEGKTKLLTKSPDVEEELPTFSPDGKQVAFVRKNDLYVVDVESLRETRLTTDGSDLIFNGKADWVYFEEILNRAYKMYWWSPDSKHIAFLRIDDAPLSNYTLINPALMQQAPELTRYPKAGAPNPFAEFGVVSIANPKPAFAKLEEYPKEDRLVVHGGWFPDSERAFFYVQDRAQTWLDFCTVPPSGGEIVKLFRDSTEAWIESPDDPKFLKDGSFLISSERTGWKHIYHYSAVGELINPVTTGEWEARRLEHVNEGIGMVYVSGTLDSPIGSQLCAAHLDGSSQKRLTAEQGTHQILFSPSGQFYIDTFSDWRTPPKVRLMKADGTLVRTLDTNPVYALEEYERAGYEMVQIPTPDGFLLEASVMTPPVLNPGQLYPVWFQTYAGPHAPRQSDSWQGGRVSDEVLARMGFVIFRCDPRSASGKGAVSAWTAYKQLGVQEMKDIETAIEWICKKPYVDKSRIGMSGHSYGGFMTAYAMTHSKLFASGISGAPVTDWRLYDTIYTERYMQTPQVNPEGYKKTSVVESAKNLSGKLLLIHGMMDDNVHAQNSMQFIDALQKANKDFELMVYPNARHGIGGEHYKRLLTDFMKRTLNPQPIPPRAGAEPRENDASSTRSSSAD
jgi:dipeptidyl-peptidase-4